MDFNFFKDFNNKKIALILFFIVFGAYVLSAGRVNNGYGDSDEIITTSYLLSVAHPPGYPLQILLTHLFIKLPIGGTVAFRANVFSGMCQALTVVMVFWLSTKLFEKIIKEKRLRVITGLINGLSLAFSALFWLYASVIEVHSLGNLLIIICIYLALVWDEKFNKLKGGERDKSEYKYFLLTLVFLGLGIGHLQTTIFIIPGLAWLFFRNVKQKNSFRDKLLSRIIIGVLVISLAFIIPNLLLFIFNSRQQNLSWYFDQSIRGFIGHISRSVYKGYYVERGQQIESAYVASFDLKKYAITLPYYIKFLVEHFSLPGLILAIMGMFFWEEKDKKSFWFFAILFLVSGPVFAMYMGIPEGGTADILFRNHLGISHRQYLIGHVFFSFFIGMGVYWLVIKVFRKAIGKRVMIMSIAGLALIIYMVGVNYEMGVQANKSLIHDFNKIALDTVEENGVLFCAGDFSCFGMIYLQEVENYRTDVELIPLNVYIKKYYLMRNPDLKGFDNYADNPLHFTDLVTWNVSQGRPSYFVDLDDFYVGFIGLNGNPFFLEPKGYLFKIITTVPDKFETYSYDYSYRLIDEAGPEKNYLMAGVKDYFANNHTSLGLLYSYMNMKDEARENFFLASKLNPDYEMAKGLYEGLVGFVGRRDYMEIKESSSSAFYEELSKVEMEEARFESVFNLLRKALNRDPLNWEARLKMARFFRSQGYFEAALEELDNILKYQADDEIEQLKAEWEASISGQVLQ